MSEPIKARFVLTWQDQILALWSQSRVLRVLAIVMLLLIGFMSLFQIMDQMIGVEDSQLSTIGIMVGAMLLTPAAVVFGVWRLSPQQKDVTYLIDDERVVLRDAAGNEMSSPWAEVRSLQETRSGFVLRIGQAGRWLARRAFTPEALVAFRALAREKLGDKARLQG